jgi:predicted dinucleotide-binding enzyme
MRIAIIGAGSVGRALAEGWSRAGHEPVFGVRDPAAAKADSTPRLAVPEAAASAAVVVLATPWPETRKAIQAAGDLTGKTIIDCTNPLRMGADGLELELGLTTSAGEMVAQWAPGASVFKSMNQVGANVMSVAANFGPPKPLMFVAGDDAKGKQVVLGLISDLGFEALDAGPLKNSRLLEPLAMLWIDRALMRGGGRDFAFALTLPRK